MAQESCYSRALLKLSGSALGPDGGMGIDSEQVEYIAQEVLSAGRVCPELAIVVGGGNIMRGANFCPEGKGRLRADHAGMLATMVNALVLQDALENKGTEVSVYSGLGVEEAIPPFDSELARADLANGKIVILAGGTGNPLFTTDTAAALRGIQLGVEVVLKATRVEGVFSSDPETSDTAEFFERLAYEDVLSRRLGVMDLCAISLCMEHGVPVRVFNYETQDNIQRALAGQQIGTLIGTQDYGHG